jgi:hypothetical protein
LNLLNLRGLLFRRQRRIAVYGVNLLLHFRRYRRSFVILAAAPYRSRNQQKSRRASDRESASETSHTRFSSVAARGTVPLPCYTVCHGNSRPRQDFLPGSGKFAV